MDRYSVVILEEELGLFGYLYFGNEICDKIGKFFVLLGWINSKFLSEKI